MIVNFDVVPLFLYIELIKYMLLSQKLPLIVIGIGFSQSLVGEKKR